MVADAKEVVAGPLCLTTLYFRCNEVSSHVSIENFCAGSWSWKSICRMQSFSDGIYDRADFMWSPFLPKHSQLVGVLSLHRVRGCELFLTATPLSRRYPLHHLRETRCHLLQTLRGKKIIILLVKDVRCESDTPERAIGLNRCNELSD